MDKKRIGELVSEFRAKVPEISDQEISEVLDLCIRKMELSGTPDDYLERLLPDELNHYIFRRTVNAVSMLRMNGYECAS